MGDTGVPAVIGTLEVVSKRLDAGLEKLGVTNQNRQKTALLATARILRKLLER